MSRGHYPDTALEWKMPGNWSLWEEPFDDTSKMDGGVLIPYQPSIASSIATFDSNSVLSASLSNYSTTTDADWTHATVEFLLKFDVVPPEYDPSEYNTYAFMAIATPTTFYGFLLYGDAICYRADGAAFPKLADYAFAVDTWYTFRIVTKGLGKARLFINRDPVVLLFDEFWQTNLYDGYVQLGAYHYSPGAIYPAIEADYIRAVVGRYTWSPKE